MTKTPLIVSLALVALVSTACSNKYASPRQTMETMVAAAKADDMDAMYACFDKETEGYLKELEALSKEKNQKKPSEQFKDGKVEYGEEKINGDKATMEVKLNGNTEEIKFVKEGVNWKISIPELKLAVEMMKGMEDMMKNMAENMSKGMQDAMKNMPQPPVDSE